MNSFDKLLTNISWLYDKGYPNFTIKEDREKLYEYLLSIGFPHSAIIELSERFIKEEIDDETIIKYRDEDGESKEMKAGSAKTLKKDHPAKIEYDRLKGKDDTEDQSKGKKLSGPKDFERELGDEPKAEPKKEKSYRIQVSDVGNDAYNDFSNDEEADVKLTPPDFGGDEKIQGKVARRLFAKMQLLGQGKDVEFSEADKANMEYLTISSNTDSGQVFFGERTTTDAGHSTIPKLSRYTKTGAFQGRAVDKQAVYERWNEVKQKLIDLGVSLPKFKSPLGKLDDPPASLTKGHKNLNHKPNKMITTRSKVSELPPGVRKILNDGGMKDEDLMLGGVIGDPKNPPPKSEDFVEANKSTMNEILESAKKSGNEDSVKYVQKANDEIQSILNDDSLSADEKLKKLEDNLGRIQKEMYDSAGKLDAKEQASVLKDFAEVIVMMKYRCQKKEAYMPASGNFPIADVLVMERDGTGKVLSINSVSVKSADKGTNIPGSSAFEFCNHFSNVYPEHKERFNSLKELHVNKLDKVKRDNLDEETKRDLEQIDKLNKVCDDDANWDDLYSEAEKIVSKEDVEKIKKSMEIYMNKAGLEPMEPKVYSKVMLEMVYRKYAQNKTKSTLDELDVELGVKYAEVRNQNGNLVVEELEGEHNSSNMQIHDKGFLGSPGPKEKDKCDDGTDNVSNPFYKKANTALKYKEPK